MARIMTAKERMLTALQCSVPDRLPASVHQWQPYHLHTYLGGISAIAAFRSFGLDASIAVDYHAESHSSHWQVSEKHWRNSDNNAVTERTIVTPDGTLTETLEANEQTQWITVPMVKRPEDMLLVKRYLPVPKIDRAAVLAQYRETGDDGILRGFVCGNQGGPWQDACTLYGTQEMIMAAFDNPGWVHEFLRALTDKKLQFIEQNLTDLPLDLVETGGGAASSTVISPGLFRSFCLPYDREIHDALHAKGHKVVYHTCGGMMPILELIVANGCDASETLAPRGVGGDAEPAELKRRIGGQVALIGGLDQFNILTDGTPEQIRSEVQRLFRDFGPGGGYILSPSDHFFETPPANLRAYADAARECLY